MDVAVEQKLTMYIRKVRQAESVIKCCCEKHLAAVAVDILSDIEMCGLVNVLKCSWDGVALIRG